MRADRAWHRRVMKRPPCRQRSPNACLRLVIDTLSRRLPYRSKYRAISVSSSTFVSPAQPTSTVVRIDALRSSAIRRRLARIANRRAIVLKYSARR